MTEYTILDLYKILTVAREDAICGYYPTSLQKYALALELINNRIKKILHAKAVTVNGKTVCDASFHVNPVSDEIIVDGVRLNVRRFVYLMMNKPADIF